MRKIIFCICRDTNICNYLAMVTKICEGFNNQSSNFVKEKSEVTEKSVKLLAPCLKKVHWPKESLKHLQLIVLKLFSVHKLISFFPQF